MKLTGNLKKKVEQTESKEEAKIIIEEAGMMLTDDELENVTGGRTGSSDKVRLSDLEGNEHREVHGSPINVHVG